MNKTFPSTGLQLDETGTSDEHMKIPKDAPKRIYLQHDPEDTGEPFSESHEITWCGWSAPAKHAAQRMEHLAARPSEPMAAGGETMADWAARVAPKAAAVSAQIDQDRHDEWAASGFSRVPPIRDADQERRENVELRAYFRSKCEPWRNEYDWYRRTALYGRNHEWAAFDDEASAKALLDIQQAVKVDPDCGLAVALILSNLISHTARLHADAVENNGFPT